MLFSRCLLTGRTSLIQARREAAARHPCSVLAEPGRLKTRRVNTSQRHDTTCRLTGAIHPASLVDMGSCRVIASREPLLPAYKSSVCCRRDLRWTPGTTSKSEPCRTRARTLGCSLLFLLPTCPLINFVPASLLLYPFPHTVHSFRVQGSPRIPCLWPYNSGILVGLAYLAS